jgi:hypothetical protein
MMDDPTGNRLRTMLGELLDHMEDAQEVASGIVVFTPSEDVQGAYYTHQLDLSVHRDGALHHALGSIQLGTDRVLLPGGEKHNAHLYFPPISLRVHEGDALVWSSIGSVGEGLAVPEGVVEIVFERKDTPDRPTYSPELWSEYVPDYWIGKDALVEVNNRDIHRARTHRVGHLAPSREKTSARSSVPMLRA